MTSLESLNMKHNIQEFLTQMKITTLLPRSYFQTNRRDDEEAWKEVAE